MNPTIPPRPASSKRIVLLSCVKSKLSVSAPAEALYTSPLFKLSRTYARQLDSNPSIGSERGKPPQWVLPFVSLLAITIILSFVVYKLEDFLFLAPLNAPRGLHVLVFAQNFIAAALFVIGICWVVYILKWIRDIRSLLREIAANTRVPPPKPPEQASPSTWPTPPNQPTPPEEAKYMPKG